MGSSFIVLQSSLQTFHTNTHTHTHTHLQQQEKGSSMQTGEAYKLQTASLVLHLTNKALPLCLTSVVYLCLLVVWAVLYTVGAAGWGKNWPVVNQSNYSYTWHTHTWKHALLRKLGGILKGQLTPSVYLTHQRNQVPVSGKKKRRGKWTNVHQACVLSWFFIH